MKRVLLVFLLLTAALSVQIQVPENVQLTDGPITLMPYVVTEEPVLLKLSWNNEKVDVFPSQVKITPSAGGGSASFLIMTNSGACGELIITLTAGGVSKPLVVELPPCEPNPVVTINASLPVEDRYISLKNRKLGTAIEYLQVTSPMKSKMMLIEMKIEEAKAESDFNKKTKLADDAWKLVEELEVETPYVTKLDEKIAEIGDFNLSSKTESAIGEIETSPVLFYKKQISVEAASGGTTTNPTVSKFTLYKVVLHNPNSLPREVLVVENQPVELYEQTPLYNLDFSVFNVTVPGNGRTILSFGVRTLSLGAVSTAVFEKVAQPIEVPPPSPEPETEPEEETLPIIQMIQNVVSGLLGELDFLATLFEK